MAYSTFTAITNLAKTNTCVISIIRLVILGNSPDFTFQAVTITSWSTGKLGCGIVCAYLPTLRPLAAKFFTAREKLEVVLGSGVNLLTWPSLIIS